MTLTSLRERLLVDSFRWAPTGLYSALVGWGARTRLPRPLRAPLYGAFARAVDARTDEAGAPLSEYASFGDFFARHLRPGVRPIADGELVSPCDGLVASAGPIAGETLVQAKGRDYTVGELVVDETLAQAVHDGQFATIYLSPRDYHRVHAPAAGVLRGYHYVPGKKWPVSLPFVRGVDRLFAVNERVVIELTTAWGRAAVVMVAAAGVGNVWLTHLGDGGGDTRAWRSAAVPHREEASVPLAPGDELGAFLLGSTVIILLPAGAPRLHLGEGDVVRVGQALDAAGERRS
ncbi:MAG TPA: archaetidylserine decarboxylase [Kofleriaceae bacterium]|nr:archaetidylserine decarboxylase [Kofleriaceae bacterium]